MSDVAELVESLDLDAALARTYRRSEELHRQAVRRRWTVAGSALGIVVALAIVIPLSVGSGGSKQSPAIASTPTTTLAPDAPWPTPTGYTKHVDGDVTTLTSTTPPPADVSGGADVGASSATSERIVALSAAPGPVLRSATVQFACVHQHEALTQISYSLEGANLAVSASSTYPPDAAACAPGEAGPELTLPLPAPLPAGTQIVAGSVSSH